MYWMGNASRISSHVFIHRHMSLLQSLCVVQRDNGPQLYTFRFQVPLACTRIYEPPSYTLFSIRIYISIYIYISAGYYTAIQLYSICIQADVHLDLTIYQRYINHGVLHGNNNCSQWSLHLQHPHLRFSTDFSILQLTDIISLSIQIYKLL